MSEKWPLEPIIDDTMSSSVHLAHTFMKTAVVLLNFLLCSCLIIVLKQDIHLLTEKAASHICYSYFNSIYNFTFVYTCDIALGPLQ